MKQDFDIWNVTKQEIEAKTHWTYVNEREICFVALGKNIGYEQDWKHERFERPVVVLKRFWSRTFVGVPLTSKEKSGKFYFNFCLHWRISTAILSQIRLFDNKRIERRLGYVWAEDFQEMKEQLKALLNL